MRYFSISRASQRLCAAVALVFLVACTQVPTGAEKVSTLPTQPSSAVVTAPPASGKAEPKPQAAAAISPVDGTATSVTGKQGSVAPVRVQPSAVEIAAVPAVTPAGATRYECVRGAQGAETRTAIAFPENSGRICARFPAMGPCQYERSACRASGGRVIRFDGIEITQDVEHEYDKQVTRFRLNAG